MFRLFLHVLDAIENQPHRHFTQRTLEDLNVPQHRQALTLLRSLELTTAGGRLQDDVLACRQEMGRFKTLLLERVRQAWLAVGCTAEEISFLGQDLPRRELKDRLGSLAVINRLASTSAKSAARSTLQALNDLLVNLPHRTYFEAELTALDARKAAWPQEEPQDAAERSTVPDSPPQRGLPGVNPASHRSTFSPRAEFPRTTGDVIQQLLAHPVASACTLTQRAFPVDFTAEGDMVHATVTLDGDWTTERLLRLAKQLQEMAHAMDPSRAAVC